LIAELYCIVDELEAKFQRKFTPDGHLVGSIGEVVAAHFYDLELENHSIEAVDAWTREDTPRSVQIKLTAGDSISLSDSERTSDILIVLKFERGTGFKEIYNATYPSARLESIKSTKRKVKSVSLSQLKTEQMKIVRCLEDHGRIEELNSRFASEPS
jgi:hypothetical protein